MTQADRHSQAEARASQQARTDLPKEAVALASRLGASRNRPTNMVHLTQTGTMRFEPGGSERPFLADQTLSVRQVGFSWRARMRFAGPIVVQVIEGLDGEAHLDARLRGVVRLAHVRGGDQVFRGEAMRYLAELVWNPDAILFNHDLEWRVLDQRRLQVAAGNGPRRVEVCLVLNDDGDPASMEAGARPRLVGRTFAMTPWFGRCHDYQWLGGRRVPCRAEAGWDLDGKPFVYWQAQCETWSVA